MLIRKENLARLGKTPTELKKLLGKSASYWRDLMRDPTKSFGEKTARYIEQHYPLPRLWLDQSHDSNTPIPQARAAFAPSSAETPGIDGGLAQTMSELGMQTVPSTTWEQIEMTADADLPTVFRVQINDGAMSPRVSQGAWVQFDRSIAPRPGDGILVRDAIGKPHFRIFKAGRPGCWEAHATSSAYAPLLSDRDGLVVLAVLTAVESRWG